MRAIEEYTKAKQLRTGIAKHSVSRGWIRQKQHPSPDETCLRLYLFQYTRKSLNLVPVECFKTCRPSTTFNEQLRFRRDSCVELILIW